MYSLFQWIINENLLFSLWVCYESWIIFLIVVECPIKPWLVVECPNWFISYHNSLPLYISPQTNFFLLSQKYCRVLIDCRRLSSVQPLPQEITASPLRHLLFTVEARALMSVSRQCPSTRSNLGPPLSTFSQTDNQICASKNLHQQTLIVRVITHSFGVQITRFLKYCIRDK